ncbi:hypothetical protein ZIOFF_052473 [Zingiber officinale]|uniref:Mitotic checkpoint protein n=1 Tax=Zingiber officinale TaxID=94328 RepID=A0A8J5FVB2_ZINOF|nr:hypothetical protein ZIOFF_052473 [Zingiber officinale]
MLAAGFCEQLRTAAGFCEQWSCGGLSSSSNRRRGEEVVAMEKIEKQSGAWEEYAFKCHRKSEAGRDTVYPVNAMAFHPIYGTFATGGCDGYVNVWDGNNKKRLYQYSKYPTSIAALSFNRDGRLLAVASSYTFEEGEIPHEPDAIFVRNVNEVEVKPKPKALPGPPP